MTRAAGLALAAAVIFAVLVLPNHPGAMVAMGRRFGVTFAFAGLLLVAVVIKVADFAMFSAFNRTFNPILDGFLIGAGLSLLRDSIGFALAALTVVGVSVLVVLLFVALERSLRAGAALAPAGPVSAAAAVAALGCAGWAAAEAGHHLKYWSFQSSPPGTAWTTRLTVKRGIEMQATAVDLARFVEEAQADSYADATGLLDGLDGRDVILIWVESYGRASFDNPLYAPTHLGTLRKAEAAIADTGMEMKSGWLTSPTAGGQSWLAHGALASGLWTSDNGRYNAMLASGHKGLFHFAQDAGYRTAAIMPAITVGWPESLVMGFEHVFPAANIPYKGARFRWVTMPDQFTLAAYPALLPPTRALTSSRSP